MKKVIIIVLVVIATIGGLLWLGRDKSGKSNTNSNSTEPASTHTYGEGKTGVKLVEYGDFQCPGCGAFFPLVKEIKEKYKDQITFQFVNFPLVQKHPNAMAAHRAAEAAAKQNKFWEYHDLLFANQVPPEQSGWNTVKNPSTYFEEFAKQLNLNMEQFKGDSISPDVNSIINDDISSGKALGISGTPTFFLNGKKIEETRSIDTLEKFSAVIDEAIKAKGGTPPASTTTPAPTQ